MMNAKQLLKNSVLKKLSRSRRQETSSSSNSANEDEDDAANNAALELNPIEQNLNVNEINVENEQQISDSNDSGDDSSDDQDATMTELDATFDEDRLWSSENEISSVSTTEFCSLLLSITRLHNLSDAAVGSLLRLFRTVLPENNKVPAKPTTLRKLSTLKKYEELSAAKMERRCSDCETIILCNNNESTWICSNQQCKIFGLKQSISEYISCAIQPQLEMVITAFGAKMLKHLNKTKQYWFNTGNVSDITNGEKYQQQMPNPCGRKLRVKLMLWSDGARPIYGRRGNIWACCATIAELPPRLRCSAWNIVTLSFFYGRGKPNWSHLIHSNLDELRKLSTNPFQVVINGDIYDVYVDLYASLLDLVARCSIWDVKQFNGNLSNILTRILSESYNFELFSCVYGCMECQHPGVAQGGRRLWPYMENIEVKDTVFYENVYATLEYERQSGSKHKSLFGVFSKSELATVLNAATDSPLDIMHNVYEGFGSRILYALFVKQLPAKRLLFFNPKKIELLDMYVKKIVWPSQFSRKVPTFCLVKQFKATEIKNCLLYPLLPLLYEDYYLHRHGPCPEEVHLFIHFLAMYVEIVRILVSDTITQQQLNTAEKLAVAVSRLIPAALHSDEQTFNLHCTLHLTKYARMYGPLHGISAFVFEGLNHVYCRLASGSKGTLEQIQKRAEEQKMLHFWIDKHTARQTEFADKLRYVIRNVKRIKSWDATVVEKHDAAKVPQAEAALIPFQEFQTALSIEFKHQLYECDLKNLKSRCNYVAKIENAQFKFVKIHRFFYNDDGSFVFTGYPFLVLGRMIDNVEKPENVVLDEVDVNSYGNFHFVVQQEEELKVFSVSSLRSPCIFMQFTEKMYITPLAHAYEHD